jgi:hypothetical protein
MRAQCVLTALCCLAFAAAHGSDARFPVLDMPDGGLAEDFLHVAGLVQVSVGNGTMREEKHSTFYHPAALRAFRAVFHP